MSAPAFVFKRNEVIKLNQNFLGGLKLNPEVQGYGQDTGILVIVGTPSIALAGATIYEAAREAAELVRAAGHPDIADQQIELIQKAITEALEGIDANSVDIAGADDPLFDAAVERFADL